jgi:hypothetical protein
VQGHNASLTPLTNFAIAPESRPLHVLSAAAVCSGQTRGLRRGKAFPIELNVTGRPRVINVLPMNRVHIDLRAGTYGHLNHSALLLLGVLVPWVIAANMQSELSVALRLKVLHHFVKRPARGRAGRVEEPAAFGATKTPKTLLFDPYQLPSHGAPRRRARRRGTKLTCAKLGGLSDALHKWKTCLRSITPVGLDSVSIAQYQPRIRHSVDRSARGVRRCPHRILPT